MRLFDQICPSSSLVADFFAGDEYPLSHSTAYARLKGRAPALGFYLLHSRRGQFEKQMFAHYQRERLAVDHQTFVLKNAAE